MVNIIIFLIFFPLNFIQAQTDLLFFPPIARITLKRMSALLRFSITSVIFSVRTQCGKYPRALNPEAERSHKQKLNLNSLLKVKKKLKQKEKNSPKAANNALFKKVLFFSYYYFIYYIYYII